MKATLNKKVGNETYQFVVEEKDTFDTLVGVAQVSTMPDYCPLCKGNFVQLEMNKSKGDTGEFTFVYIRCKTCGAKAQIGQYKSGGIFWKKFEAYEPKSKVGAMGAINIPTVEDDDAEE